MGWAVSSSLISGTGLQDLVDGLDPTSSPSDWAYKKFGAKAGGDGCMSLEGADVISGELDVGVGS